MKKLFLLLFVPLLAFTAADWIKVDLDNRFSVLFPSEPVASEAGGNPLWTQDVDSNSRCMAMIFDFSKMGVDSAAIAAELENPEAYESFKTSMMAELSEPKLVSEKIFKAGRYPAYEIVVEMAAEDGGFDRMHARNFFVADKMYSISFFERTSNPQKEQREKFLNSYKIK